MIKYKECYLIKLRKIKDGGIKDTYYTGYGDKTSINKSNAFRYVLKWMAKQVAIQFLDRNGDFLSYFIEKVK